MSNNKFQPQCALSLYDGANKDSDMIDDAIRQQMELGGVIVYAYRYLGTPPQSRDVIHVRTEPEYAEPVDIGSFLGIEDPLLLENRDRAYDFDDVPRLNGVFKVSQNDMIYGRFGPQGMNNDVFSIEFHTGTVETQLGRRFIIGDVLEFPHLKDTSADGKLTHKLYEVARVMRSPTGWDPHYVNHVLALIIRPVRDCQEFIQFMERYDEYGKQLVDQIASGPNIIRLNDELAQTAAQLTPSGIWDTTQLYFDPKAEAKRPDWTDHGVPPNGLTAQTGIEFPPYPKDYDYLLRTDMVPNRMFQYYNDHWNLIQIDKHMVWQPYAWVSKWQDFLTLGGDKPIEDCACQPTYKYDK